MSIRYTGADPQVAAQLSRYEENEGDEEEDGDGQGTEEEFYEEDEGTQEDADADEAELLEEKALLGLFSDFTDWLTTTLEDQHWTDVRGIGSVFRSKHNAIRLHNPET